MDTAVVAPMEKLGLGLSGGGFRATLFHLGVLRRLAELDLLRELSIISSVSGGSILAAHYMLLLQRELEARAGRGAPLHLERTEYVALVDRLEAQVRAGIARNPRARLFANPWENLKLVSTWYPLGERMAGLYRRHFYRHAASPALGEALRLMDLRVAPVREIDLHNRSARVDAGVRHDRVPKLVLNATSLNGGSPFLFTAAEVGDPRLGFVRFDELERTLALKQLVEELEGAPAEVAGRRLREIGAGGVTPSPRRARRLVPRQGDGFHAEPCQLAGGFARSLAFWLALRAAERSLLARSPDRERAANLFREAWARLGGEVAIEGWPLAGLLARWEVAQRLLEVEPGVLRRAKLPAWYLVRGGSLGLAAAAAVERHVPELVQALQKVAPDLARLATSSSAALEAVAAFVVDLYQLRGAAVVSHEATAALDGLGVHQAVAASANFPPIFAPYVLQGLYDPWRIARLGLSDGGVYDNQGITTLLDEECSHLVVSDAGGSVGVQPTSPPGRFSMSARLLSVLMGAIREQELARAHDAPRLESVRRVKGVAFFQMESAPEDGLGEDVVPPPPAPSRLAHAAAAIRTDLDAFEDAEMDLLVYQGYQLADRFVRKYLAAWLPADVPPATALREPGLLPEERRIVLAGRFRFLRWFHRLAPAWRAAVVGALLAAVAGLSAAGRFPSPAAIGGALARLAAWEWSIVTRALPWLPDLLGRLAGSSWTLPVVLLAVGIVLVALRVLPLGVRSQARLLVRGLWWLVLLAPLWLVLLLVVVSWASWGGYELRRSARRWRGGVAAGPRLRPLSG